MLRTIFFITTLFCASNGAAPKFANLAEESAYGAVGFKDGVAAATADPFACTACIWAGKIALNYSEPINKGVDSFCKVVNLGFLCSGGVKLFFVTLKLTGPRAACKMVKMCPRGIFTPVQIPSEMEELASALEGVKNELNEFGDRQLVELEQLHAKFHEGVADLLHRPAPVVQRASEVSVKELQSALRRKLRV
ncbi:hypothetical protein Q1695_011435 [Nippostrongylus brasiliensis]|nr:hypothetical protein Q1695_011435 [Nippostrongylus brasiliensis]